jgi:hypothetical protein
MYENRIRHLEEMHQNLNKRIDGLEKTGVFEDKNLLELKKQKLAIRDELSRLQKLQWEHNHESVNLEEDR